MKIILVLSGQHSQSETIDDTYYSRMHLDMFNIQQSCPLHKKCKFIFLMDCFPVNVC